MLIYYLLKTYDFNFLKILFHYPLLNINLKREKLEISLYTFIPKKAVPQPTILSLKIAFTDSSSPWGIFRA